MRSRTRRLPIPREAAYVPSCAEAVRIPLRFGRGCREKADSADHSQHFAVRECHQGFARKNDQSKRWKALALRASHLVLGPVAQYRARLQAATCDTKI